MTDILNDTLMTWLFWKHRQPLTVPDQLVFVGEKRGQLFLVESWGNKARKCLQQNEVRRHGNSTETERGYCARSDQKWLCRGQMTVGQSESSDMGKESHNLSTGKNVLDPARRMKLVDDTTSPTPVRYQVYGISLKLNPDKDDWQYNTYNSLGKKNLQLWVRCANYRCNVVYDVTYSNDTQRNVHLTQHHMFGVTPLHDHDSLYNPHLGKFEQTNTTAAAKKS